MQPSEVKPTLRSTLGPAVYFDESADFREQPLLTLRPLEAIMWSIGRPTHDAAEGNFVGPGPLNRTNEKRSTQAAESPQ